MRTAPALLVLALLVSACGDTGTLTVADGTGSNPKLPPPNESFFPTVNVAKVVGWQTGAKPIPAPGLEVNAFAEGLDHPRWLLVLPNGDVLVAETNAPPSEAGFSIRRFVADLFKKQAGAQTPSANRITLLRDADGDGRAELKTAFITGLNSPFGMTLVGDALYVANTDAVLRFPYEEGETRITAPGEKIVDLPAGPINHHWTKNIIARPDGKALYVTVGSNSNVAENGLDAEENRAAILEVDLSNNRSTLFAFGLRNPNGMDWNPDSGALWTVVNERDEIGSDLVPDYLTSVAANGFYGWPFSYFGQTVDTRVKPSDPNLVARAIRPDYALGPHVAALGLAFSKGTALGSNYASGAFIGLHGSWNRKPPSGYKVIFVPFEGGRPFGKPVDVLTGFLDGEGQARGRPVGVAIDTHAGLLVADDVGNRIWRVSRTARPAQAEAD